MVTDTLVIEQIEDGMRLLTQLSAADLDIRAAFWAKPHDDDRWSLYFATSAVNSLGSLGAYRVIFEQLRKLGSTWFSSSDVKVIDEKADIAVTISEIQRRFPDATRLQQPLLNELPFEEVYIYPLSTVEVTIYGMTYRETQKSALHLSFKPHDPNSYLEVQSHGQPPTRFPAITGIDTVVAAPFGSKLEQEHEGLTVLSWNFRGKWVQSSPNEVWSLAKLGLHGFRILNQTP